MSDCDQCKKPLQATFVTCNGCHSKYHFSPCCPLSESTYSSMYGDRKNDWRCHKCKPRKGSNSNNSYHIVIEEKTQQKQKRDDDEDENNDDNAKRFKDPTFNVKNSIGIVKSDVTTLKTDVTSIKTDINEIKTTMQQLATNITQTNNQINSNIQNALSTITNTLTALSAQVSDLSESNKEKDKQINEMDKRINNLEQQMINKNIEIKNINDNNISANDVVKTIAASVHVEINDTDISNSYRLNKSNDKVIIEFSSANKKKELMSKISRHRIDSKIINKDDANNNYIYVNDQLTANNRRLLWLAKNKAAESNWKFVWVRNGTIFAKKNEISKPIIIKNAEDIELISLKI